MLVIVKEVQLDVGHDEDTMKPSDHVRIEAYLPIEDQRRLPKSTMSSKSLLNPSTKSYEFLGPPGALFITFVVPFATYFLYFACSEHSGGCPPHLPLETFKHTALHALSSPTWWANLWDTHATVLYFAWYAFCVVSWAVIPGDWVEGVVLRTGERKKYKINGKVHRTKFLTSVFIFGQRFQRSCSHWV
jgi:hypothetical protein